MLHPALFLRAVSDQLHDGSKEKLDVRVSGSLALSFLQLGGRPPREELLSSEGFVFLYPIDNARSADSDDGDGDGADDKLGPTQGHASQGAESGDRCYAA